MCTLLLKRFYEQLREAEPLINEQRPMSAIPPKADIVGRNGDVRFVPKADMRVNRSPRQPVEILHD
jgi:hypothetical protein